ncbi:MAG: hypothetical protein WCS37_03880 [Chloroflexota bacterium]|nr:hypothetical protein [Chloroflexota bacterium]
MNAQRRKELEELLSEAYSLKGNIERKLLTTTSPTEGLGLKLELEKCDENIKRYKGELEVIPDSPVGTKK